MAAISTGGFSPHDASLQGLSTNFAQTVVITISMAGAVPLLLYHRTFQKGWRIAVFDRQLQAFLATALLTTTVLALFLQYQDGLSWTNALRQGALNGLSALSTAGFSSMQISEMADGSKLTLIIAMALGGCAGSTAGGIKIIRLLIVFRLLYLIIQRAGAPPQAVLHARLNGSEYSTT